MNGAPREAVDLNTRLLKCGLEVGHCRAYWSHAIATATPTAQQAFDARKRSSRACGLGSTPFLPPLRFFTDGPACPRRPAAPSAIGISSWPTLSTAVSPELSWSNAVPERDRT